MSKPIKDSTELLRRLLAGQELVKCQGIGWAIGPEAAPVDPLLVRSVQGGAFRLALGGDGLPGIGSSQTIRLERLPTSEDLLYQLRRKIQEDGGLTAFSTRHGVAKGAVGSVENCTRDMTAGVAATLGFERIIHLWRPLRRGASA